MWGILVEIEVFESGEHIFRPYQQFVLNLDLEVVKKYVENDLGQGLQLKVLFKQQSTFNTCTLDPHSGYGCHSNAQIIYRIS